jgi:hypothetical protein
MFTQKIMTDLSKMTQMELLDLRMKVNQELDNYSNREKTKVCSIFVEFLGTRYFLKPENALKVLKEMIEEGAFFNDHDEVHIGNKFLDNAALDICEDYHELNPEK